MLEGLGEQREVEQVVVVWCSGSLAVGQSSVAYSRLVAAV